MGAVPPHRHLERYPGKHIATDMKTDEVVFVANTPRGTPGRWASR